VQQANDPMWHVTLTMAGDEREPDAVRASLERLAHERPFLLTARYSTDRAELRYWEQAGELEDAAALALRLWGEHRNSADLPPWRVTGLEVVDRETYQLRAAQTTTGALVAAGAVTPF
jgi:hypothetical protein